MPPGHLSFAWLVALVVIGAFFDGPGATARDTMVPELASAARIDLDRVNACYQGARRLSLFIGPIIAGFLIALVGTSEVLWINAVAFGLSAMLTVTLIPSVSVPADAAGPTGSFLQSTLFGFRFIRRHRLMFWLACIVGLMSFLDAPLATVMLPALVSEQYGAAAQVGILIGSDGAGAVIGTIVFSLVAGRMPRRRTFIGCFFVVAAMILTLSTAPAYPLAIIVMLVKGIASGPLNPILMSIRQEFVPIQYRARIFGTMTAIAFVAIPLGQLAGGDLIEWMGIQPYTLVVGVAYLAAVVSMVFTPALREMDTLRVRDDGLTPSRPGRRMPADRPPTRAEEHA